MAYYAGDVIVDDVNVADADQNPSVLAPSAVFTSVAVTHTATGTAVTPVLVSAGETTGQYLVTWTAPRQLPGAYVFVGISAETGETYTQTYDVEAVEAAGLLPSLGAPGITLGDFRALLGDKLLDHLRLTATEDGSANTFIDVVELTDGENAYESSQGTFLAALTPDVDGARVSIVASSGIEHSVTFEPALPGITHVGDVLDLFNLGGHGFRVQQYDSAIRRAIEVAFPEVLVDYATELSGTFSADLPVIDIPPLFVGVHTLEINEGGGSQQTDWRPVPRARRAGRWGEGWTVDKALRQIRVDGRWRDIADGYGLRVRGYARQEPPQSDNDLLVLDRHWLLLRCASELAGRRVQSQEWSNWAIEWGRQAEDRLLALRTDRAAGTVMLW